MAVLLLLGGGANPAPALFRLRFSRAESARIAAAASFGPGPDPALLATPATRRRWMARTGRRGLRDVFRLWLEALRAGTGPLPREAVLQLIAQVRRDQRGGIPLSVGELAIAGRDLLELGWSPGPRIGRTLGWLLEAVWEDPALNRRATLLRMARAGVPVPGPAPGPGHPRER